MPEPAAPAAPAAEPAAPVLDSDALVAALNRFHDDPERRAELAGKLRSHPLVANIAGDMAQRQRQAEREVADRDAADKERARLRDLRTSDPVKYAEEMGAIEERQDAERRAEEARVTTRQEITKRLGTVLRDIPEVKELTAEEHAAFVRAVAGASEDDVLPITQKFFTDLIADKRAAKKAEAAIAERLKAERKAWEKEQADKRLRTRPAPSAAPPPTASARDTGEPDFRAQPKEWEAWYEEQRKAGRLVRAR